MRALGMVIFAALVFLRPCLADDQGTVTEYRKFRTIIGEVIAISCYVMRGETGEAHRECALASLKAGQPGGIIDDVTGRVYIAVKEKSQLNANQELIAFAGRKVKATGIVADHGGLMVIDIRGLEPVSTAEGAAISLPGQGTPSDAPLPGGRGIDNRPAGNAVTR